MEQFFTHNNNNSNSEQAPISEQTTVSEQTTISEQEYKSDVRTIRKWVQFFGILTVISLVSSIIGLLVYTA